MYFSNVRYENGSNGCPNNHVFNNAFKIQKFR